MDGLAWYPVLRHMAWRKFKRTKFIEVVDQKSSKPTTLLVYIAATTIIICIWILDFSPPTSIFSEGWRIIIPNGFRTFNYNLFFFNLIFSSVTGFIIVTLQMPFFVSSIEYVCRSCTLIAVILFAVEWIVFSATCCTIEMFSTICSNQHEYLWGYFVTIFSCGCAMFGLCLSIFFFIKSIWSETLFLCAPLSLVVGHRISISHCIDVDSVENFEHLTRLMSFENSHPVMKLVKNFLSAQEVSNVPTPEFLQPKDPINKIGFIAWKVETIQEILRKLIFSSCGPAQTCTFDMAYLGQLNMSSVPHGIGSWMDLKTNGERLTGYWNKGFPEGPFESFDPSLCSAFSANRNIFVCPSAIPDALQYGVSTTECCLSAVPLQRFPSILSVYYSPAVSHVANTVSSSSSHGWDYSNPGCGGVEMTRGGSDLYISADQRGLDLGTKAYTGLDWGIETAKDRYSEFLSVSVSSPSLYAEQPRLPPVPQRPRECLLLIMDSAEGFEKSLKVSGFFTCFAGLKSLNITTVTYISKRSNGSANYWGGSVEGVCEYLTSNHQPQWKLSAVLEDVKLAGFNALHVLCVGGASEEFLRLIRSTIPLHKNVKSISMIHPRFSPKTVVEDIKKCRYSCRILSLYLMDTRKPLSLSSVLDAIFHRSPLLKQFTPNEISSLLMPSYVLDLEDRESNCLIAEECDIDNIDIIETNSLLHPNNERKPNLMMDGGSIDNIVMQHSQFVEDFREILIQQSAANLRYPKIRSTQAQTWSFQGSLIS